MFGATFLPEALVNDVAGWELPHSRWYICRNTYDNYNRTLSLSPTPNMHGSCAIPFTFLVVDILKTEIFGRVWIKIGKSNAHQTFKMIKSVDRKWISSLLHNAQTSKTAIHMRNLVAFRMKIDVLNNKDGQIQFNVCFCSATNSVATSFLFCLVVVLFGIRFL